MAVALAEALRAPRAGSAGAPRRGGGGGSGAVRCRHQQVPRRGARLEGREGQGRDPRFNIQPHPLAATRCHATPRARRVSGDPCDARVHGALRPCIQARRAARFLPRNRVGAARRHRRRHGPARDRVAASKKRRSGGHTGARSTAAKAGTRWLLWTSSGVRPRVRLHCGHRDAPPGGRGTARAPRYRGLHACRHHARPACCWAAGAGVAGRGSEKKKAAPQVENLAGDEKGSARPRRRKHTPSKHATAALGGVAAPRRGARGFASRRSCVHPSSTGLPCLVPQRCERAAGAW